jgi:hypothetical protein
MQERSISPFTIVLIGGAMWSVAITGHELIGHGGICAIDPNCTCVYADAMYFHGDLRDGAWTTMWRAAGSSVNVAIGIAIAWRLRTRPLRSFIAHLALWQLMAVSILQSGSYIAFGWAIDPGMDWAQIVAGSRDPAGARRMVILVGAALIVLGVVFCSRSLADKNRLRTVLWSYIGFAVVGVCAATQVPTDNRIYMLMGGIGSSALFMSWLFLAVFPIGTPRPAPHRRGSELIARSTAAIVIAAYVFVLGPGVSF